VELECAVYGEGTVFPVKISRDAKVSALQEAIFYKKRYNNLYKFDSSALTLYLARKKEGDEIKWLKDDSNLDALLRGDVDKQYTKMRSSWKLNDEELLGMYFEPKDKEIHVLMELPHNQADLTRAAGEKLIHDISMPAFEIFDKSEKRTALINALQKNGPRISLLGRENQIGDIANNVLCSNSVKTSVGILCATRGMGKTTLLKALVDPEGFNVNIQIPQLTKARSIGRLAVVDLNKYERLVKNLEFPELIWIEIIANHLNMLFERCMVNGIDFRFKQSARQLGLSSVESAFEKWVEFTTVAYEVNDETKPIILLDEIGVICKPTSIPSYSKSGQKKKIYYHNLASLALKNLMNRCYVIVAGTKDGDLNYG
jgi:hypothetical protein